MDAEKFRTSWWSAPASEASLEIEEWMETTFANPAPFWSSLIALQKTVSPKPPESVLGTQYDFYHDCVTRHIESNAALIHVEESGFVQTWTFKKLHRHVNFQVKAWLKNSVKTGNLVVILMPVGIPFLIALLTALRLGLIICFLPVDSLFLGKDHLTALLEEIDPDFVITLPGDSLVPKDLCPSIVIDNLAEDDINHEPASFAYPSDQIMQLSLALYRKEPYCILPLDAHTTYMHALRDGLLTLNLKPGMTHGTAHSCPIRCEPCSTLMTLLAGATLALISEAELIKDPEIIKGEKFNLLEISPANQKLWSKNPGAPKQLKGFYKTPLHHHHHAWRYFVQSNKLEEIPAFHLLMDNSLGGVLFFSKPTTKDLDYFMKPSLGTPWSFKDINGSGQDSIKGFGLISLTTSCKENNEMQSNLLVSQIDKNHLISSALLPSREGVTVPIELIEETAAELDFVESCILITFPKMGEVSHHQFILLVFVNPAKKDIPTELKQEWNSQVSAQISNRIGAVFIPEFIEYYPLIPKMNDSLPDRNWCIEQYNRGMLSKKKSLQIYQVLNMLKQNIIEQADAIG